MSDLDSFFARRDQIRNRKKSATDSKPASANGDDSPREVRRKTEEEDDDWKSMDGDEKKDYSGLKIQPLILPELDEADSEEEGKPKTSGPWKVDPIEKQGVVETIRSTPVAYVNPREREIQRTKTSDVPDVKNALVFPSLSEIGLRSNQSVWNRTLPAVASVQVCRVEKTTEERGFVRNGDSPRRSNDTERSNWRKDAQGTAREVEKSWRKPHVDKVEFDDSETVPRIENATEEAVVATVVEEPKIRKYVPPYMRQELAT